MKRLLFVLLIFLILLNTISCRRPLVGPNGEAIVLIRVMGEFTNTEKVIARYQEMVRDDPVMSMILPRIVGVAGGDYRDRLNLSLISQERFSLMFIGAWFGLTHFIQQGLFYDITRFFNNDDFPGLQRGFPPEMVEAMHFYVRQRDGSFRRGIFGINLADFFEDTRGIMYREDLRIKYNLPPIVCDDTLILFLETVLAEERAIGNEWIGLYMWNLFRLNTPFYWGKHYGVFAQDSTNLFGDQTHIYIGLCPDNRTVLNAVVAGDSPEEFAKMPPRFQYDFITESAVVRANNWNRFLPPQRGTAEMVTGESIASYTTLSNFESVVRDALIRRPYAKFGFYVKEEAQRNMIPGAVINEMVTNNWMVIPAWADDVYNTMRFLDWMFGSRENHNLFHLGIEGEDWIAIGDYGFARTDISDRYRYTMPPWSLTSNPNWVRKSEWVLSQPELRKRFEYMYCLSTYQLSPFAGFIFDPRSVQTEIANITALSNELQLTISRYDADEAVRRIQRWHQQATRVGLERVRAELIKQVQEFLDFKNAN